MAKKVSELVEFRRNPYSSELELKLKATDAQLRQLDEREIRRMLAMGLKGNDYKRVMMYAKG